MEELQLRGLVLRPSPKYQGFGTHRIVPPQETLQRVRPLLPAIGATRVADLTGLDRLGIPVTSVTVPTDRAGISVYNGKGLTMEAALAGAMMEAVERYSAENVALEVTTGTYQSLSAQGHRALDPGEVPCYLTVERDLHTLTLDWIPAVELFSGEEMLVPARLIGIPWPSKRGADIWLESTNGLGSGNTLEEAICHALAELIERDAHTLAMVRAKLKPNFGAILQGERASVCDVSGFDRIDLATVPDVLHEPVRRIQQAGLKLIVREITSDLGIPAFAAAIVEESWEGQYFCHGGFGAHPDAEVALSRAITEAAQGRAADFQGTREDLHQQQPSSAPDSSSFLTAETGALRSFATCVTHRNERVDQDILTMLGALQRAGLSKVFLVDLTQQKLGVPVVRLLVPGLEMWSENFFDGRGCVLGARARAVLEG